MLAMLSTWIADSGAYVVGKFLAGKILGRHKLSPRLSPNKTIEGYIGGIFFGILVTLAIAQYMSLPLYLAFFIALFASAVSPLGDLGISMIKREVGVKDSGMLFPGHGGALDRIDSLMWSVAAAYYFVIFFS
jgi:phosphatidate cytidylyltransferase